MKILQEFKAFLNRGNVVDLAVAVVIGGAFGKIVTAVVSDLVMPLVNAVVPQGDWRLWEVSPLKFRIGDFLGTVVDFLVVAFVVFIVMVKLATLTTRGRGAKEAAPATRTCPECLESVPAAARRCRACTSVLAALGVVLLLLAGAGTAHAQATPKFEYGKVEEVKTVEWKTQAKGGLLLTSGNSETTNATIGLNTSRKEGSNKLAVEAGLAYGKSNVIAPVFGDPLNPTLITGITRQSVTSTNNWLARGRYDRFFTLNNAGYVSALASADKIAGKSFAGGGQIGYSRQLQKTELNLLVVEIGYDFSYESYVSQPNKTLDPISIHSARLFATDTLKLSADTGVTASVEALFNLNEEGKALQVDTGPPATLGVGPFKDTRVTAKAALTTTVYKALSIALGVTLRYDQNPAPRPVPSGAPAGSAYAATFQPFADKVDTIAEASLIYTFL